jgi:glutathione synthase/RimK-type ligase-like ATP-grasp enzyme
VIVVWGPPDDPPTTRVLEQLREAGADVVHLEDSALDGARYDVTLGGGPSGWVEVEGRRIRLDEIEGLYLRPGPPRTANARAAAASLLAVAASIDAVVVNRPTAGRSNLAKPYQLAAIRSAGFAVPPTIVTTDPSAARTFLARHGRIVYKSVSGVRSIVATLDAGGAERLSGVATGPVQLQRWIDGIDVRVHVVGTRWFATAIESAAADYRYAAEGGHEVKIVATHIDDDLGRRLVELAAGMGLLVAGIDLRLTPDDEWYCFEVNPSPGFTFYEDAGGQPIAAAIAGQLRPAIH